MAENLMLSERQQADGATLTGGDWHTATPLANLQDKDLTKFAISQGSQKNRTKVKMNMTKEVGVRLVCLINNDFTQSAEMRFFASNKVIIDADDISFDTSDDSINSVSTPLDGDIVSGDTILVANSVSNNVTYTVDVVATNKITVTTNVTTEVAVTNQNIRLVPNSIFDSGVLQVWDFIFPIDTLIISDSNFLLGRLPVDDLATFRQDVILLLDSTVNAQYWDIDFDDETNLDTNIVDQNDIFFTSGDSSINSTTTDLSGIGVGEVLTLTGSTSNNGQFEVVTSATSKLTVVESITTEGAGDLVTITAGSVKMGRLWMSSIFQPSHNFDFGSEYFIEDLSTVQVARSGKEKFNKKPVRRGVRFTLNNLTEDEAMGAIYNIYRLFGISGEVVVLPFPDNAQKLLTFSFFGSFKNLAPIRNTSLNRFSNRITIKERL